MLIVALGTSPAISRGVLRGATGRRNTFARTVKGRLGWRVYPQSFDWLLVAELFLAVYAAVGLVACALQQTLLPIPFLLACVVGFGYVGLKGLREQRPSVRMSEAG